MQPAPHGFSPQGRGPYPVLPLPTRVICFRLRGLTGSFSWVLCGDCTLCTIHAAFLVGLGEPRSRKSRNCCTTPTRIPHCNPRVFPFASEIGRHCIKNLATQLPPLGDQVSRSGWGRMDRRSAPGHRSIHVSRARRPSSLYPGGRTPLSSRTDSRPLEVGRSVRSPSGAPAPSRRPRAHAFPYLASPAARAAAARAAPRSR